MLKATDVKSLSVAVEKTAGTIAAVEKARSSSVGDACSKHVKLVTEDRMRHHQKVVAKHAGLVPDGTGRKCQGVWRGGQEKRGSAD